MVPPCFYDCWQTLIQIHKSNPFFRSNCRFDDVIFDEVFNIGDGGQFNAQYPIYLIKSSGIIHTATVWLGFCYNFPIITRCIVHLTFTRGINLRVQDYRIIVLQKLNWVSRAIHKMKNIHQYKFMYTFLHLMLLNCQSTEPIGFLSSHAPKKRTLRPRG